MSSVQAWAFMGVASGTLCFGLLALVRVGMLRLEMPIGLQRDGIRPGRRAPSWSASDLAGVVHGVPSDSWQALVFADHSLRAFPDLVVGLSRLAELEPDLEILVLSQASAELSGTLRTVGVIAPIVCVDRDFYRRHDVRAMPFTLILSPGAMVQASGLTSGTLALFKLWRSVHPSTEGRPLTPSTLRVVGQ